MDGLNIATGDLNGDGLLDLVLAGSAAHPRFSVQFNSGAGLYHVDEAVDQSLSFYPHAVLAADLNGDGHVDVATTRSWEFDNV